MKPIKKLSSAEVHLGYYKQGDDMGHCLFESKGEVVAALQMHSEGMQAVIEHLKTLASVIKETGRADEFSMDADTHMIMLHGPDELINILIEKELVSVDDEDL